VTDIFKRARAKGESARGKTFDAADVENFDAADRRAPPSQLAPAEVFGV
jgi:hypothetical protein